VVLKAESATANGEQVRLLRYIIISQVVPFSPWYAEDASGSFSIGSNSILHQSTTWKQGC
jgi:hypothetical protein